MRAPPCFDCAMAAKSIPKVNFTMVPRSCKRGTVVILTFGSHFAAMAQSKWASRSPLVPYSPFVCPAWALPDAPSGLPCCLYSPFVRLAWARHGAPSGFPLALPVSLLLALCMPRLGPSCRPPWFPPGSPLGLPPGPFGRGSLFKLKNIERDQHFPFWS